MTRHSNNGHCPKCREIIDRFPNFNAELRTWFEAFQAKHPELHVSEAGRGKLEQERDFQKGASRAHWTQSAHNYNMALDTFVMLPGTTDIYPRKWYDEILRPALPTWIQWYGMPGSVFFELPHIEVRGWKYVASKKLVE